VTRPSTRSGTLAFNTKSPTSTYTHATPKHSVTSSKTALPPYK